MITLLEFKTIAYDSLTLPPNTLIPAGATYELFTRDKTDDGERVTKVHETVIIRELLNSVHARNLILNELGADGSAFVADAVKHPVIKNHNDRPGDVDLLICPRNNPAEAIGIQAKRVIIRSENQETDRKPNKLDDLKGAVKQTKLQIENLGFHRNYLAILLQIDVINRDKENVVCAGALPSTLKRVYEFPQRESLPEDAGIIFIRLCQPTVQSFYQTGSVGICIDKPAGRMDQRNDLTNRIKELMRMRSAI